MKIEKSCGAIVFNEKDEVLIIQQNSGIYGFPKGHMEVGENEIQTAIRETKEETNADIDIVPEKRFYISYMKDENIRKEVVYFVAYILNESDIHPQENELQKVMWVSKNDVVNILSFDNLKELWLKVLKD